MSGPRLSKWRYQIHGGRVQKPPVFSLQPFCAGELYSRGIRHLVHAGATMGSDSEEELLAVMQQLESRAQTDLKLLEAAANPTGQGARGSGGAGTSAASTVELSADRALTEVETTSSWPTAGSVSSSSSGQVLPIIASAADLPGAPGTKRRRIASKGADPFPPDDELPAGQPDPEDEDNEHAGIVLPANTEVWAHKSTREKRMFIGNRLRQMNWHERFQTAFNKRSHRAGQWPCKWTDLNDVYKQKFVEWWAQHQDNSCRPEETDWAVKNFVRELPAPEESKSDHRRRYRTKQVLLTYNGEWGNLPWSADLPQSEDVDALAAVLQKTASVQQLWEQIKAQAQEVRKRTAAEHYAVCLEICPGTLQEGALRVHVHLALVSSSATLDLSSKKGELLGSVGISKQSSSSKKGRAGMQSTIYYVMAPKIGQVWSSASSQPYKDFTVNAEWTWNLLQGEKVTAKAAREEFVRGKKNLSRHLMNLDVYMAELAARVTAAKITERNVHIQKQKKALKVIPEVTEWMNALPAISDRKKFLVLNGPSRLGKTQFAVGLYGAEATLEVNCAGASHPPLRIFCDKTHRCIIFDEAPVNMVLGYRRLFQAPNCHVVIGQSPTNQSCYPVYLNDTALVVCSNSWAMELTALPESDASWILANMIFVQVTEKLWVE